MIGTIDEIKIHGDEDGFHLTIYFDDGSDSHEYRIGLPDQFDAEVRRTIGAWLAEGEGVRATVPAESDTMLRHSDGSPYMDALDYHDTMSGLYDNREGK